MIGSMRKGIPQRKGLPCLRDSGTTGKTREDTSLLAVAYGRAHSSFKSVILLYCRCHVVFNREDQIPGFCSFDTSKNTLLIRSVGQAPRDPLLIRAAGGGVDNGAADLHMRW